MGACSPRGRSDITPPIPPLVEVWRSVRAGGDTKTMKSRRTIALPDLCVMALLTQRAQQDAERRAVGDQWHETGLVFTTRLGTAMDAANVRRDFRRAVASVPGLTPDEWTPRELRHSFVSLLSDAGVPIEDVSRLVGHSSTSVTELVYRHQIRPSSRVARRSWIGSSVRRPTVALLKLLPLTRGKEPRDAPVASRAPTSRTARSAPQRPLTTFETRPFHPILSRSDSSERSLTTRKQTPVWWELLTKLPADDTFSHAHLPASDQL